MLIYRMFLSILTAYVMLRGVLSGRAGIVDLRDRLARGPGADGPHVWLHAASNGELTSVRPVIDDLLAERPRLNLLITCNSAGGVALARGWRLARTQVRLAPLDTRGARRRMRARWGIVAHIAVESELWPNRFIGFAQAGIPVIVLGGRLSARTALRWDRFGSLPVRLMRSVSYLSAQDAGSATRFAGFGLTQARTGPLLDLKSLYAPPAMVPSDALRRQFARMHTWLAASTHEGDEAQVIAAHKEALRSDPDLRLILAIRHPARGDAVARMLTDAGLTFDRRSQGDGGAPVLLADTLGEMALWYALAGRVFIGGTWSDRGGHTPYEPAAFGCALLHGPDVANFAPAFERLSAAGAARRVTDAADLAAQLTALHDMQARMGDLARATLTQDTAWALVRKDLADRLPKGPL